MKAADFDADCTTFVAQGAKHAQARPAPRAVHAYAALALCRSGSAGFELGGRWAMGVGDVVLVPAGAPHRTLSASDFSTWMVGLSPVGLIAEQQQHLLEPFERVRNGAAAVVHIDAARRPFVEQLLTELKAELAHRNESRLRHSLLTLLMAEVSRAAGPAPAEGTTAHGNEREDVTTCLRYIERHCLRPLSLHELSKLVHRSPGYLTTLLRKHTGKTAGQWILEGRMAEARRRLLHSDEHVDIIAERVGYADATHFTRLFRRAHGLTPTAFRARRPSARG